MKDLSTLRHNYSQQSLHRKQLHSDPFEQFNIWLEEALAADPLYAHAMSLATVDVDGQPSVRTVLLKGVNSQGFVFYSNIHSQKGQELAQNPKVSLLFHWLIQERQVRIEGTASQLSREEVAQYFHSRPRASQLSAWASRQSEVVDNRQQLLQQVTAAQQVFENREVDLPDDWGGYRVTPTKMEFWQGQSDRLHDRFLYERSGTVWQIQRLSP